jgi:hypothetical protein
MAHIDAHAPGSFCWIELSTSDQQAGKHFYSSLFGWTANDSPMGNNECYTMFQLEGRNVAAAYTIQKDEVAMGVPPHWNLYIAVENADESTARATELGGTVLAGPFDVMEHGRMAVVQDPTGAVFCMWQSKAHPGIGIQGQANALCWADLSTPDQEKAVPFYEGLFGYQISAPDNMGGYLHIMNGEEMIGGVQSKEGRNKFAPPHWLIYIMVEDCNAMTDKAKGLGANVHMGPVDMENVGWISVLADPQGAVFALFQPAPRG